jgi:hypothetical protein
VFHRSREAILHRTCIELDTPPHSDVANVVAFVRCSTNQNRHIASACIRIKNLKVATQKFAITGCHSNIEESSIVCEKK